MSPLFGDRKDAQRGVGTTTMAARGGAGWRFSLKGSPRHYDDVAQIIVDSDDAIVYFGEALTYERGAGVALWRIRARDFSWVPKLYDWWANQERIEPIDFTFHLYIPPEEKYPALNLRDHTPDEVIDYIKRHAPQD
ncbi:MAG TPA: hypothetical protein VFQ80_06850 [Thermomicrobiales bacterium]|jgi:hypothetical protein|nr:hypothetical protein [Thermomicrobiales bacterium]